MLIVRDRGAMGAGFEWIVVVDDTKGAGRGSESEPVED